MESLLFKTYGFIGKVIASINTWFKRWYMNRVGKSLGWPKDEHGNYFEPVAVVPKTDWVEAWNLSNKAMITVHADKETTIKTSRSSKTKPKVLDTPKRKAKKSNSSGIPKTNK